LPRMGVWRKAWRSGKSPGPGSGTMQSAAGDRTPREQLPIGPWSCPSGHRLHPHRTRLRRRRTAKHPKRPVSGTIVPPPVPITIDEAVVGDSGDGARSAGGHRGGATRGGQASLSTRSARRCPPHRRQSRFWRSCRGDRRPGRGGRNQTDDRGQTRRLPSCPEWPRFSTKHRASWQWTTGTHHMSASRRPLRKAASRLTPGADWTSPRGPLSSWPGTALHLRHVPFRNRLTR
jgi:hypothetical protein